MQRSVIISVLFLFLIVGKSYAQMGAAQTAAWDIDEKLKIAADRDDIWRLLKNPQMAAILSNGFVQSVENQGEKLPYSRVTTFKDGSIRTDDVTQQDEQYRFLSYRIPDSDLPKDLTLVQVAIFTRDVSAGGSELNWKVLVEGKKDAKDRMLQIIKKEVDQYRIGFTDYFKKKPSSTPAIRMY